MAIDIVGKRKSVKKKAERFLNQRHQKFFSSRQGFYQNGLRWIGGVLCYLDLVDDVLWLPAEELINRPLPKLLKSGQEVKGPAAELPRKQRKHHAYHEYLYRRATTEPWHNIGWARGR